MPDYRERLWATPWMFIITGLLIPASILVLAPISLPAGIITGVVLYLGVAGLLLLASPVVEVSGGELRAAKASIPLEFTGEAVGFAGTEASAERGRRLDVRAFLMIRGWVSDVVRVEIVDPKDPTPYWLISSRKPNELAAAINGSRRPESSAGNA
ncbi:DUF3093 domain-containing protein [Agromyces atrinae]|uniref:DUF3093 domain-containing protein n=1 Tax=Agromyces atrinae TaxID=592376 RepID=A0A4Q2M311_9MICO|nr:DUF3093 domain-containing protein [Agromyces atrinae]NYD65849.1 hypothetical protein [Agromyces atrinae]RXZ86199.1 DUF3093 domain-containing protein [Agromyces atrinae]